MALALSVGAPISPLMIAATLVVAAPSIESGGVAAAVVGVCRSPDWVDAGLESEVAGTVGVTPFGDAGAVADVADVPDAVAGIPAATALAVMAALGWSGDATNVLASGGGAALGGVLGSVTAATSGILAGDGESENCACGINDAGGRTLGASSAARGRG